MLFIFGIIVALIAVGLFVYASRAVFVERVPDPNGRGYDAKKEVVTKTPNKRIRLVGAVVSLIAVALMIFSVAYTQGVGQAKVIIDFGGKIASQDITPGIGFKAPWQKSNNWDLFAQEAVYAGSEKGAPDYTGGKVNGQQVTASVKGGAQTNYDLAVSYNLDGTQVSELYKTYRDQERFTRQAVEPLILAVARDIPNQYSPAEFRGEKRGEATTRMTERLNKELSKHGIKITLVTIQNIRYDEDVEASIKQVEVAQQKMSQAEAELRATEVSAQARVVEAEAEADATRVRAQGEADANALLSASLTPQVLQQRYIDAISSGKATFVVPEGSNPLIQVPSGQ